jgi:hypothetical protein
MKNTGTTMYMIILSKNHIQIALWMRQLLRQLYFACHLNKDLQAILRNSGIYVSTMLYEGVYRDSGCKAACILKQEIRGGDSYLDLAYFCLPATNTVLLCVFICFRFKESRINGGR